MSINEQHMLAEVQRALVEDIGSGDITARLLPETLEVKAHILSREPMVVCGIPWVNQVFHSINPAIHLDWQVQDGDHLDTPQTLCQIKGQARDILTAERTALNFLQTLSATATKTAEYVAAVKNTSCRILDTRKTLPGLRYAQKYAVTCGGGFNHRLGLYDAFLIKENHIKACGSLTKAIHYARQTRPDVLLEVEVETLSELQEALKATPDRILLDNFSPQLLIEAVKLAKPFKIELEASGGVNLNQVKTIAQTGVSWISIGALTKSIQAIDLSLLFDEAH